MKKLNMKVLFEFEEKTGANLSDKDVLLAAIKNPQNVMWLAWKLDESEKTFEEFCEEIDDAEKMKVILNDIVKEFNRFFSPQKKEA